MLRFMTRVGVNYAVARVFFAFVVPAAVIVAAVAVLLVGGVAAGGLIQLARTLGL